MIENYLSCPILLTEALLIQDPEISALLDFLEGRGYAKGTIPQYLSAVIHFESWCRSQIRPQVPDLQLDVDVFLNQHLVDCNCPRLSTLIRAEK